VALRRETPVSRDIVSPRKTNRGDELIYPPRMESTGIIAV